MHPSDSDQRGRDAGGAHDVGQQQPTATSEKQTTTNPKDNPQTPSSSETPPTHPSDPRLTHLHPATPEQRLKPGQTVVVFIGKPTRHG